MSLEEQQQHVALPKLYGAPAYARPPKIAPTSAKPFDPDDLPIAAVMTNEERDFVDTLPARAYAPGGGLVLEGRRNDQNGGVATAEREQKPSLRALAGRLLRGN